MIDGRKMRQRRVKPEVEPSFSDADTLYDVGCRRCPRYRVKVQKNKIGLYRITLTDSHQRIGEKPGFEGCCVRELYTYDRLRMNAKFSTMTLHGNPPDYCSSLIKEWNCADPDGPISLDSTPEHRVALVPNQPPLARPERST